MGEDTWPFPDPRIAGMREHLTRVQMFLDLAHRSANPEERFRLLIAGVYFARAIAELMFEATDSKQVTSTRDELKTKLPSKLPWFNLIEKIRIHDFHRFGLLAPNPKMRTVFHGGPMKLQARKGAAVYAFGRNGPLRITTGDSTIKEQRPLLCNNGMYFDEETNRWLSLDQILTDYLKAAPEVIDEFQKELNV
ncbi:MAG TPA: hypothetical protein VM223_10425 [Planctomycetota bacterium]|nr:hypothetical protein [Planctomycetota bacterium]